jgi:hypothetical protein
MEKSFIARQLKIKAGIIDGRGVGKGIKGQIAAHTEPVIRPAAAPDVETDLL